jgi:hypothetical protein
MARIIPVRPLRSLFAVVCLMAAATALPAFAQEQDKAQQACLNGLGKNAAGVAKAQGKEAASCLGLAAKGADLPGGSLVACLDADPKDKVAKAEAKTVQTDTSLCLSLPDFGYQPAATVNDAARAGSTSLLGDWLGGDMGTAVVTCETDRAACGCQAAVLKAATSSFSAKLKTYLACKKKMLSGGAASVGALADCVDDGATSDSIAADTKGKLAKKDAGLEDTIVSACLDASLVTDTLFPGECVGHNGDPGFADCIDDRIECRVCEMLNRGEALGVDCDLFDDGAANASCVDFAGDALFSVGAGQYVGADPDSLALFANEQYPAKALDYFELVDVMGEILIRNTGNGKYLRVEAMDSVVYADAEEAAATRWVIFTLEGGPPTALLFFRDGPPGLNVDALKFDGGTGKLTLVNASVLDVLSDPAYHYYLDN